MLLELGKFIMQCGRVLSPELEEESLREEFDDLVTEAKVLDKHSAEKPDVLALQACMSRFEQQKSRRLHKSLMNFPTGISLQKEVSGFIAQVAFDERCDTDLALALKTLVEPPVCDGPAIHIVSNRAVTIGNKEDWVKMRNTAASIHSRASEGLKEAKNSELQQLDAALRKLVGYIRA
jgi:hypothetical protein